MKEHKLFWGEIHTHTNLSDGNGSPEDNFEIARSHLDFWAMAAHEILRRKGNKERGLAGKKLELIPEYVGGTVSNGYWLPGKGIGIQEDFGQMVSPRQFREMVLKHILNRVIRGRGTRSRDRYGEVLGNAFPTGRQQRMGRIDILKEEDSPTFMYLLSSVIGNVGDPDDPTVESWGGRWYQPFPKSFPNYYTDLDEPPEVYWEEIKKWRPDFLADWEKRWEWYD